MIRPAVVIVLATTAALAACVPPLPGGSLGGTADGAAGAGRGGAGGSDAGAGTMSGGLRCPGLATFDKDTQGFAPGLSVNLAGSVRISWIGTQGDPAPGALSVGVPFTDYNQSGDVEHQLGSVLANWTGYRLHVRVKVGSGGNADPSTWMGVEPYAHAGYASSFCGAPQSVPPGDGWNDYVLDLAACQDASMVSAYGVRLLSGSGADADGGVSAQKPSLATVLVDSFWLEGSCGASDGGGDGDGDGGV
ncbi:MAG TPA: hypothetical protein VKQ32_12140 [Polyangia bacterium]|nr:hypothetical protein [Polyangia bacterium]